MSSQDGIRRNVLSSRKMSDIIRPIKIVLSIEKNHEMQLKFVNEKNITNI